MDYITCLYEDVVVVAVDVADAVDRLRIEEAELDCSARVPAGLDSLVGADFFHEGIGVSSDVVVEWVTVRPRPFPLAAGPGREILFVAHDQLFNALGPEAAEDGLVVFLARKDVRDFDGFFDRGDVPDLAVCLGTVEDGEQDLLVELLLDHLVVRAVP